MPAANGTPMSVLQSRAIMTLRRSPATLIATIVIASNAPHRRPSHRPTAAARHANETVAIRITTATPSVTKPSCPRGLICQSGSSGPSGDARETCRTEKESQSGNPDRSRHAQNDCRTVVHARDRTAQTGARLYVLCREGSGDGRRRGIRAHAVGRRK